MCSTLDGAMKLETQLRKAAFRYAHAQHERDRLITQAAEAGMTRRAIAQCVGLSFARVQQIITAQHAQQH